MSRGLGDDSWSDVNPAWSGPPRADVTLSLLDSRNGSTPVCEGRRGAKCGVVGVEVSASKELPAAGLEVASCSNRERRVDTEAYMLKQKLAVHAEAVQEMTIQLNHRHQP